jgi:HEAT repeat protein
MNLRPGRFGVSCEGDLETLAQLGSQCPGLVVESFGGVCPVQAWGTLLGFPFYFRARHEHWSFEVEAEHEDPMSDALPQVLFQREEAWGEGEHDAGYMPEEVAADLVVRCAWAFIGAREVPHEAIREAQDRTWTTRLVARLRSTQEDDLTACVDSLITLEDFRATPLLHAVLEDTSLPREARDAAGRVLRELGSFPEGATLRAWWAEGDALLRRHALWCMGIAEEDIVLSVLKDDAHPQYVDALRAMSFGFEAPHHQALKLRALTHAEVRVRCVAADVLHWDEPACAEEPLLRSLTHTFVGTDFTPPDAALVVEVLKTLRYYPTLRVVEAATRLAHRRERSVREAARGTLEELRYVFHSVLDAAPSEALLAWMKPAIDTLGLQPSTDKSAPLPTGAKRIAAHTTDALIAMLDELDGPWRVKLETLAASTHLEADKARLVPYFEAHPDPLVRARSCALLAAWGEQEALVTRLSDAHFEVRKLATYYLGLTRPNASLASRLWDQLHARSTTGTHADETLNAYVTHAPLEESRARLVDLVNEDEREPVRKHAVHALMRLQCTDEVLRVLPLLKEPPRVTWAVHIALLEACKTLGLRPDVSALRAVDHLDVQVAVRAF